MTALSDVLKREKETRAATCPEHGDYVSTNLFRSFWSKCPECDAQKQRERDAAEREARAKEAAAKHQRMLNAAAIPARFIGRSFDDFIADADDKRHALTVLRDYAENFAEHSRKGLGLILGGKPGTGKSHLAGAVLQALLSPDVRYITCMDMIRAVRETWRRDSERSEGELLRYFECLDLLVIDEIGAQYGSEGEQQIVFDVLDRRYRELRPSILMTNQNPAGLKAFVGERTYDRLRETCTWVPFEWESYRPTARKEAA